MQPDHTVHLSWSYTGDDAEEFVEFHGVSEPFFGIEDGIELYFRFHSVIDNVDLEIEDAAKREISAAIRAVDARLGDDFWNASMLDEFEVATRIDRYQQRALERVREHREVIDAFLERFPDERRDYPGMGFRYPSIRHFVRKYVEHVVGQHGHLPTIPAMLGSDSGITDVVDYSVLSQRKA